MTYGQLRQGLQFFAETLAQRLEDGGNSDVEHALAELVVLFPNGPENSPVPLPCEIELGWPRYSGMIPATLYGNDGDQQTLRGVQNRLVNAWNAVRDSGFTEAPTRRKDD